MCPFDSVGSACRESGRCHEISLLYCRSVALRAGLRRKHSKPGLALTKARTPGPEVNSHGLNADVTAGTCPAADAIWLRIRRLRSSDHIDNDPSQKVRNHKAVAVIIIRMDSAQHENACVVVAAGGLIVRKASASKQVMIVHRKRYGDWTLPKGKLKEGESYQAAALREVKEETGCLCQLGEYAGALGYQANGVPKVVLFWRMSVIEQGAIQDLEESKEVEWLSIPAAIERLTYDQEKTFLERLEGSAARSSRKRHWFYGKLERERLSRELAVFTVELQFLERRSGSSDTSWVVAARQHLLNADRYLKRGATESGWVCLHAAQRYGLFGLTPPELANRASSLRHETKKISGWRSDAMKDLVKEDEITRARIFDAMAIRDEHSSNQYYKIWLTKDQLLKVLIPVCVLAFLSLIVLTLLSPHTFFQYTSNEAWKFQTILAVLVFGLLGASFSVAQSLMSNPGTARIPERVENHYVTLTRLLSGAIVGLASYAFFVSKAFTIKGLEESAGAAFTIAFLFGYTGEKLVARVAGSASADKPKS